MSKKEISNKTVISLFNQNKNIQDLKEELKGHVYLTSDTEEFKRIVVEKKENSQDFKYDHVFYLHQLRDGTWGIININRIPGYDNYWFSISNRERDQKEINDFLSSLGIKCSGYSIDCPQNIASTGDIIKESTTFSIEVLENYLSLLKNKGDYGWAWVELKITPERQQELGERYEQIEQEKFFEDFQEVARNEGVDISDLSLNKEKEKIIGYWKKGYDSEQVWKISKLSKELDAEIKARKDLEDKLYELHKFNKWESERKSTQEWFDKKYPKEKRNSKEKPITKITIDGEGLIGELSIEGFEDLKEVNCFKNKLTNLKIIDCPNIENLNVSCNSLRNFDFLNNLNPEKLTQLSIHSNDFKKSDLSVFSRFTSLEELYLDNYDLERISNNTYNRFYGSLEPLKELKKLRLLNIGGTDINEGLEHLPASLRKIGCEVAKLKIKDSECSKIKKLLEDAAEAEGTKEVLKKAEEGDTQWSKDWPRIAPWKKVHNLKNFEDLLEKRKELVEEINHLEKETKDNVSTSQKETGLESKKAELKQKDWEIESLRKEITGESLIAEHQNIQEEIGGKEEELKELKERLREEKVGSHRRFSLSSLFSFSGSRSGLNNVQELENKMKSTEEEILKLKRKEIIIENDLKSSSIVTKAPLTPAWLLNNEGKLRENEDIKIPSYDKIYPNRDGKDSFFLNDWQQKDSSLKREFPTKLFNASEFLKNNKDLFVRENIRERNFKKIEWEDDDYWKKYVSEKNDNVKDYAILSYVWGDTKGKKLGSGWSKKSLLKAVKALEIINKNTYSKEDKGKRNIDYLWMDQLCIDQNNPTEKAQEVRKMRKYYSDASVTLVVIHTRLGGNKIKFSEGDDGKISKSLDLDKILKVVVKSEWFSRSWTYQEGWLGKNTIFMFDNILVDGRDLAATWVLNQPSFTDHAKYDSLEELSKNTRKIATPLGWVRYEGKYNSLDKVTLRLHEALRAIKGKGRAVSIDGIYSILGLLPYGEHVEPKYSGEKNHEYTRNELQEAFLDVMQVAWENGYGEIFAWHGSGDNWIPDVDTRGKSSIEGGISIDISDTEGLKILEHTISEVSNDIVKIEGRGYTIDSGTCTKGVGIDIKNGENEKVNITLLGIREVLEKVNKGDVLLIPAKENGDGGWSSNKPFAIVVKKDNADHRCRLGLVEIKGEGLDKLQQGEKELKVKEVSDVNKDEKLEFEELFEIPPKK